MHLKLVILAFASVLLLAEANYDESYKEFYETCITETGASKEEAVKLKDHDFSSEDPKVKCFAKCFCEKAKMCDDKSNMVLAKIEEHIPDDMKPKIEEAATKCAPTTGADQCDTVYQKFKCFFANLK